MKKISTYARFALKQAQEPPFVNKSTGQTHGYMSSGTSFDELPVNYEPGMSEEEFLAANDWKFNPTWSQKNAPMLAGGGVGAGFGGMMGLLAPGKFKIPAILAGAGLGALGSGYGFKHLTDRGLENVDKNLDKHLKNKYQEMSE
jgi:hypothetical protein